MTDVPNVLNQRPDDPRLLLSEPFRAVHFVFGLFHPDVPPLSGRALVGSLAALGFGEEASRGIVLRLRRAGFLESRRSGRKASYAMSLRSLALIDEIARRSTQEPPPWDGAFRTLLVRIPVTDRAFREQLRRHAAYAGFANPLPGLLIAPYESSMLLLEPLLAGRAPGADAPRPADVTVGRLAVDRDDAVRLAREGWDLETLASALRHETKRMAAAAQAAETDPPDSGAAALQLLWRCIGPFFGLLSASLSLPAELLPPDWPMDAARDAFFRLAAVVAEPARAFVTDLDGDGIAGHGR